MLALAIHPAASPLFAEIPSDRHARLRADERGRKRGIRMFGCQSRMSHAWSVAASSCLCTSDSVVCKTRSWC